MSAQAQAGPCALANGWGGHPGRSSSWALGGGAQGQRGWWEKQQGEGGGDGGPSAPPGLTGWGRLCSESLHPKPRLPGWSLFSGWKSLTKALDTNGNSSGSQGQAQETEGLAGWTLTAPLYGVPCQGPQSQLALAMSAEQWSIRYHMGTDHNPFSLWLLGSSGAAASVHPSPWLCTNLVPDSMPRPALVFLAHSLFVPL